MKNLILLLLVIGAVVNAFELTTSPNSTVGALWSLTYATPTATSIAYSITLSLDIGMGSTLSTVITANTHFVGVICMPTNSDFLIDVGAVVRPAYSFSVIGGSANPAQNIQSSVTDTDYAVLKMTYHPLAALTTATTITTGATSTDCAITSGASATNAVITNGVVTWTLVVTAGCGNFPKTGQQWYAKCYAAKNLLVAIVPSEAGGVTLAGLTAAKDVSVVIATAACATTGASTFATGATILAGIAYLQF
jgi:hypothetical protein